MAQIEDVRRQFDQLKPSDQVEFLRNAFETWLSCALASRGIEEQPDICGGEPRIIRTRIPVWVLEQMRRQGLSEADILRSYPTLRASDLVNAWNYVEFHRDEIDRQIRENEEA